MTIRTIATASLRAVQARTAHRAGQGTRLIARAIKKGPDKLKGVGGRFDSFANRLDRSKASALRKIATSIRESFSKIQNKGIFRLLSTIFKAARNATRNNIKSAS